MIGYLHIELFRSNQSVIFQYFAQFFRFLKFCFREVLKATKNIISVKINIFFIQLVYPTNLHISTNLKSPIVTSKLEFSILTQVLCLLNKSNILESRMVSTTFVSIVVMDLIKSIDFINKSFEIEG